MKAVTSVEGTLHDEQQHSGGDDGVVLTLAARGVAPETGTGSAQMLSSVVGAHAQG